MTPKAPRTFASTFEAALTLLASAESVIQAGAVRVHRSRRLLEQSGNALENARRRVGCCDGPPILGIALPFL
jgi:hypothetical protein